MNHARLALAGWMVLNLAGVAPRAMAQEVKNQGPVVCGRGAQRTIVDTVVTGSVDARTLRAALEVLPRRPKRIDVVDDQDLPAAVLKEVARLDAFVLA